MRRLTVALLVVGTALAVPSLAHAALAEPWSGTLEPGGTITLSGSCTGFDINGNQVPGTSFSSQFTLSEAKGPPPIPSTVIATGAIAFNPLTGAYSGSVVIPASAAGGENVYSLSSLECVRESSGEPVSGQVPGQSFGLTAPAAPTTTTTTTTIPPAPSTTPPATPAAAPAPPAPAPPAAAPPAVAPATATTALPATGPVTEGLPTIALSVLALGFGCLWLARRRSATT